MGRQEELALDTIRLRNANYRRPQKRGGVLRGTSQLLNRPLTQAQPMLEINGLGTITREVVEVTRRSLVIG